MRLHNKLPDYNKLQFKKVCHGNCYTQIPIMPHGQIKDTMSKRMTTSYKGPNPMGDTSFYKRCSRSFSLIVYLLNIVLYNIVWVVIYDEKVWYLEAHEKSNRN